MHQPLRRTSSSGDDIVGRVHDSWVCLVSARRLRRFVHSIPQNVFFSDNAGMSGINLAQSRRYRSIQYVGYQDWTSALLSV
jgi:hypothetical protein